MASPEAIARMAQQGPKSPEAPPIPEAASPNDPALSGGGLETVIQNLDGVGKFLQSKGPQAQAAMAAFQSLLRELSQLGQGGGEEAMEGEEPSPMGGRVHESQRPGVQVL